MTHGRFPRSLAKFIRKQKGLIRRSTQNAEEQERLIRELIGRIDGSRRNT